jgi:hypothetical protein
VADRWRSIAPPPGSVSARSPWTWTGDELLVWPDGAVGEAVAPAAYDPATDRWRDLPTPPVASRQEAASVWTGGEWLLWGGADGRTSFRDGAAYDPATGAWRVLPASPLSPRRAGGVWTGGELLVAAGSTGGDPVTGNGAFAHGDGAAYDPATDEWRRIADGPAHPGFEAVWTGERLLLFAKGAMFVYDSATDRWSDGCCDGTPAAVAAAPVWTGEEALLVGSAESGRGGIAFRPAS